MSVSLAIPKIVSAPVTTAQTVHVAKHGSDVNGDGSENNPYLTVNKAMSVITDATSTKPYSILVAPGIYSETALALKNNVYINGTGNVESLACRIGVTGNLVTVDLTTFTASGRFGISNIYFSGTTGLNADLSTASANSILVLNNVAFNGAVTYKANNSGSGLEWFNGICYGNITVNGAGTLQLQNGLFIGTNTFTDSSVSTLTGTIVGGQVNSVVLQSTSKTGNFLQIFGCNLASCSITQTAGDIYVAFDAVSYPYNGFTRNSGSHYKYTDIRTIGWNVSTTATAAGTTTLNANSNAVQVFTGSTTQAVTLPAANLLGAGTGNYYIIKNLSSGDVTINRAGSDTIDGATSFVLTGGAKQSITLVSDGVSAWYIL